MKKSFLFVLTFFLFTECQEESLDSSDPNRLLSETFYKTANDATSALNAVYGSLQTPRLYSWRYYFVTDLISDEATNGNSCGPECTQNENFTTNAGNRNVSDVWGGFYAVIFRANLVLDNVRDNFGDQDAYRNAIAQAKFLRAFAYFNLVTLWGDVPLITTSDVGQNLTSARAPAVSVYAQIIKDYREAIADLPATYPADQRGRITSWGAKGFLGQALLYTQQYAEAETVFADVVNNGPFSLVPNYLDNFTSANENNAESLFEIQYSETFSGQSWCEYCGGEGSFRQRIVGPAGFDNVRPTDFLVNEFETADPRKAYTLYLPGISTYDGKPYADAKPNVRKYSNDKPETTVGISPVNIRVLRFADVLLMYAEVLNENGKGEEARAQINKVRARVGMPNLPTGSNQAQLFERIVHERVAELSLEQKRWFDLTRWNRANKIDMAQVLRAHGVNNFTPGVNELLPIPQKDIDQAGLKQNNGY